MSQKIHIKKIAQLTGHNGSIYALSNGSSDAHVLTGAGDGWIVDWDLKAAKDGQLLAKVETRVFSLLHLPERNWVLAGNMAGGLHWVDLQHPDLTKNVAHHENGIFDLLQIDDFVFSAGGEGILTRWSIEEKRTLESVQLSHESLRSLAFAKKRNEIAVGASDNCIYILDADTLFLKKSIERAHGNSVFTVKYSPDEKYLISGGRDAHLNIWQTENNFAAFESQPAHWFTLNDIAFHPDGHLFATASRDKTIKIWDAQTFELLKVLDTIRDGGHVNSVNALYWSAYQNLLISASDDRSLILWHISM